MRATFIALVCSELHASRRERAKSLEIGGF
jgi:hypothetical protein